MSSQGTKSSKPSTPRTPTSQWQGSPRFSISTSTANSSSFSSISSHMAMVELKQNILSSLSKLADRDTYQIAVSDLESTIQTISQDAIPMLLNCLFDSSNDPKPAVKKESIRLLAFVCANRGDSISNHLTKIISHLSRRSKDSDSGVRDACRDAIGALSSQYLNNEGVVGLFAKPLFEAMGEQSRTAQAGAAICMAKMVDSAAEPPIAAFQKMCPKIYKLLNNPHFLGKAALLTVVSSLSQVGAIASQSFHSLLQGIQECLRSPDWTARKAAAEALTALAVHSTNLITEGDAASTLAVLEGCRFDKIKPVRDSMMEALQLWKKIFRKGDEGPDDLKSSSQESENQELQEILSEKNGMEVLDPGDSVFKVKGVPIPDKAVLILKKKAPTLTDKDLNPEFFQKLETWGSGDWPIEVIVPQGYHNRSKQRHDDGNWRLRAFDDENFEEEQREWISEHATFAKSDCSHSEGSASSSSKGNLMAIQRKLLQLERQQAHLMNMLQDFMGGSHSNMITLENRVRGLERVVEDMARGLSISPGRRGSSFATGLGGGSTSRSVGKFWKDAEGRIRLGERFSPSMRGRNMQWKCDTSEHDGDNDGVWDKGAKSKSIRHGEEGPSARSVWQASKDEATLEGIRVAGEDGAVRVAVPELGAESREVIWCSWSNAMDALQVGDTDAAYAEVLSTGDDLLLVKLMERSGPAIDQLSSEVAAEVLHGVAQFLLQQNLFDICLCWIQQLLEIVLENGSSSVETPIEVKKQILFSLHQSCSAMDPPDDWEGAAPPHQLLLQLASAWEINLQQLQK